MDQVSLSLTNSQCVDLADAEATQTRAAAGGPDIAASFEPGEITQIINDPAEFLALESEWSALFERCAKPHSFFQCHGWNRYWCKHFLSRSDLKAGQELFIICGRKDGRLAAIWPLVRKRRGGLVVLEWMGDPVSQYGDILVDSDVDAARWCSQALAQIQSQKLADALVLRKVREDASIAPLLRDSAVPIRQQQAPYLDLGSAADFDSYAKRYGGKVRKNRRRHRRRLAEQGEVSFDYLAPSAASGAIIADLMRLKRQWGGSRGIVSRSIGNSAVENFFVDIATTSGAEFGCRVSALNVDGGLVAGELGFECKGGYVAHLCAYDDKFRFFSPGNLQCEDTLRACYKRAMVSYDFLAPCDSYKLNWSDSTVQVNCYVQPLSAKGRLYGSWLRMNLPVRMKAAYAALPERVRTAATPLINKLARRFG